MTRQKAAEICQSIKFILDNEDYSEEVEEALNMAIQALQQEPKRGKWLDYLEEGLKWECSECGSKFTTPWHYCPNCGARMESDEE